MEFLKINVQYFNKRPELKQKSPAHNEKHNLIIIQLSELNLDFEISYMYVQNRENKCKSE